MVKGNKSDEHTDSHGNKTSTKKSKIKKIANSTKEITKSTGEKISAIPIFFKNKFKSTNRSEGTDDQFSKSNQEGINESIDDKTQSDSYTNEDILETETSNNVSSEDGNKNELKESTNTFKDSDKEALKERLKRIANNLENIEDFINDLDIKIPAYAKKIIIDSVNSDEIKDIIKGINEQRPPRLALIGRSGVGKSSLINAITGSYLAETKAVGVGTIDSNIIQYKKNGEIMFEIIDTRGFKENIQGATNTAEDELTKTIKEFEPDAFLMLNNGSDRTTLKDDAFFFKEISEQFGRKTTLVTVLTRMDQLEPSRYKDPSNYPAHKKQFIAEKKEQAEQVLHEMEIPNVFVVPVSSYIEWSHPAPDTLTEKEQQDLTIQFDGRYNIDTLVDFLGENIDFRAAVHMMLDDKADHAIKKIANRFVKTFSTASAGVATTPIPASDIFILVPIQILEVTLIAYLKGIKLDAKAAREFIFSLGGVALFGLGLRFVAQQGSKLLNLVVPGSGSVVSGTVAYTGTYAVGQAAISYYIDGKTKEEVVDETKKYEDESQS